MDSTMCPRSTLILRFFPYEISFYFLLSYHFFFNRCTWRCATSPIATPWGSVSGINQHMYTGPNSSHHAPTAGVAEEFLRLPRRNWKPQSVTSFPSVGFPLGEPAEVNPQLSRSTPPNIFEAHVNSSTMSIDIHQQTTEIEKSRAFYTSAPLRSENSG